MGRVLMFFKRAFAVLALLLIPALTHAQTLKHRFIGVDNFDGRLIHVDQLRPNRDWQVPIPKDSRDLQLLDFGRVMVGHNTGCGIYSLADGHCLERVEGFTGVVSARWRTEDELWLGANAPGGYEFHILRRVGGRIEKTSQTLRAPFKTGYLRLARFTPVGHLLFAAGTPSRIVEWDPWSGKTIWEAPLPGKGYLGERLADGTTAASTSDAGSVVLFDKQGNVIRTWLGEAVREKYRIKAVSGFEFLPNGNLVVANWLGHQAHGMGPHLVEVDAENRMVWSWEDHQIAKQITNVLILE